MLTSLPMQRVALHLLADEAPQAALAVAECGVFNPEASHVQQEELPERPGDHYRELVRTASSHLEKVAAHLGVTVQPQGRGEVRTVGQAELQDVHDWLAEAWKECSWCEEQQRRAAEEEKQIHQLERTLDRFAGLDVDLGRFQRSEGLLDLHIGNVPQASLRRMREALALAGYMAHTYRQGEQSADVVVAGPRGQETAARTVLEAAGFRPLDIPPEFRDHPQKVREDLTRRRREVDEMKEALADKVQDQRARYADRLHGAAFTLAVSESYAELSGSLRARGGLAVVGGWVPRKDVPALRARLEDRLGHRVAVDARDPLPEERRLVPSALHHPRLLRPFFALVKNYGTPRYGEIDPTLLFAVTYVAMFGMMFGDVGQGAVIAAAGIFLRRRLGSFAPFVLALGLSSVAFGFIYGSVFGYEGTIIHPLWMSPLHDPILMLNVALFWGMGFIVLATALTVRNRLVERDYRQALLDSKGLAGLLFYLGMIFALFRGLGLIYGGIRGEFGLTEQLAVALPLAAVLAYKWSHLHGPLGEKVLVVVIEGFETVMSYVSNTLSFLRVAAFSLNHVALAIAVFTLAGMMDTAGHWITVVLGNVFILVLEGAIVAIQVLRLEYYEGFSRFFSGDGREYRPLTLALSNTPRS